MTTLTADDARAFLERWKLVEEEQAVQLRRTSMETKLNQLAALMASREMFGADLHRDQEVLQARERWARVRQAVSG